MTTVAQPTPRPYYVGAQNDEIYIVAGERPAKSNDYPRHDADRHVVAKVYSAEDAAFIVLACNSFDALTDFVRSVAEYDRYDGYDESEPELETLRRVVADIENRAKQLVATLTVRS